MKDFVFRNPTKIIFGKNAMDQIRSSVEVFGQKVLLTYGGGSIKRNGIYEKVAKQLGGLEVKEFGGIEPNPRLETIRRAKEKLKGFDPDIILAVGGGSSIDGSKLLASSFYYDGDPWDFLSKNNVEPKKYIPLGTILTVAATGSEMNSGAVITRWETHEKKFFARETLYPKFSILDPQNTFSLSREQTAYGVADAFSHVLEQYIHTVENTPLQDRFSESILLTLIESGPKALKNPIDYDARANIMLCAAMALNNLIAIGTGEDWATHSIEHELSAFYDIPHGAGLAIITPRWMEVVKVQKKAKLAHYGRRIWGLNGADVEVADQAIKKTYGFFKSLGIKMLLSDWNVDDKNFPTMIDRLTTTKIGEHPLTKEQIEQILTACLS